jgi:hypothetical protein
MNKPDSTSKAICQALRDVGAKVDQITSASGAKGIPDILVSYGGAWFVAEIKGPKGLLSQEQIRWHAESRAPVYVLKTVEDAMDMLGMSTVHLGGALG